MAATAGTNWRFAIGQRILFHLRLKESLCVRRPPLARSHSHLEKREVCMADQRWPSAGVLGSSSLEARMGSLEPRLPGVSKEPFWLQAREQNSWRAVTLGCKASNAQW